MDSFKGFVLWPMRGLSGCERCCLGVFNVLGILGFYLINRWGFYSDWLLLGGLVVAMA